MNTRKLISLVVGCMLLTSFQLLDAQTCTISGKVLDKITQNPLVGADVVVMNIQDTTRVQYAITNAEGVFTSGDLRKGQYKLRIYYMGYQNSEQTVLINFRVQSLGTITLAPKTEKLKDVTVVGQAPPVTLKGDTTEFNASSFKVNPDANVEDLVKKMPGVTSEDGTVKAQGEEVKKVLVDGKPFFGDDPNIALRNLPAEIVDKIQVFDQASEQSQLTGFNDGETTKTMNIVTRSNRRNGQFGKVGAAYGDQDRYIVGGTMNKFKGAERITAIVSSNNLNQQNFTTQDIIGAMGFSGGGGRGGRGGNRGGNYGGGQMGIMNSYLSGPQSGLSTVNSIGLNFGNSYKNKLQINGSYFLNNNNNKNNQVSNTQNILSADSSTYTYGTSNSTTKNFNNRLNLRIEYQIDSMNTLYIIPSLNFQTYTSNSMNINSNSWSDVQLNSSNYSTNSNSQGYSISNRMTYRHKFVKPGRTFSVDFNTSFNERTPYSKSNTDLEFMVPTDSSSILDQVISTMNSGYTLTTNIAYTEPIGKMSMIQINANNSYTKNYSYKRTSDLNNASDAYIRNDAYSNKYLNYFITNHLGLSYLLRGQKYYASAGFDVQRAGLNGHQTFPMASKTDKLYTNVLPNALINFRMTQQSHLILNYRTSTNPPSISQLQGVPDRSADGLRITYGNPNLSPQYAHSMIARVTNVNRESGRNFFVLFAGTITQNSIGSSTTYDSLNRASVNYLNKGTAYNLRSIGNFGFPVKLIKSNLNITGGVSYTRTPGFVNGLENISSTLTYSNGIVIGSNISEKVDFTLAESGNYNIVKNSVTPDNNNNYYSQNTTFRFNWILWKGFTYQTDLTNKLYTGLSASYNQNITLWNMGIGKKFMKNQAAEVRFTMYDLLNQNSSVSRSISSYQITDSRDLTLSRYFLVSFTYTFRKFTMGSAPDFRDRHRDGFGGPPPPGMGPGRYHD